MARYLVFGAGLVFLFSCSLSAAEETGDIQFQQLRGFKLMASDANALSLGHFSFGPIVNPSEGYPIEVTMQYDHEGIVTVGAKDAQTGQEMAQTLSHDSEFAVEQNYDAERDLVDSVQVNGA